MKTQKMISIDINLIPKLKDLNASELINNLLIDFFKEDKLEVIKEESENLTEKIEALQAKEKIIKDNNLKKEKIEKIDIPQKLKDWFLLQTKRPNVLEVDLFIRDNLPERDRSILEYMKEYDKLAEISNK